MSSVESGNRAEINYAPISINQDCDFKSLEIILEIYRDVVKSSLGRAISHHIALLKSGSYSYLTLFSRQGNVDTYAKHTHEHQKWDLSSISSAFNRGGAISRQPQWNVRITTRQSQLSASIIYSEAETGRSKRSCTSTICMSIAICQHSECTEILSILEKDTQSRFSFFGHIAPQWLCHFPQWVSRLMYNKDGNYKLACSYADAGVSVTQIRNKWQQVYSQRNFTNEIYYLLKEGQLITINITLSLKILMFFTPDSHLWNSKQVSLSHRWLTVSQSCQGAGELQPWQDR